MKEKIEKILSLQEIEHIAIKETKDHYKNDLGIILVGPEKGQRGFDLKYIDGPGFVEVKGTSSGTMALYQRQLTHLEYEKAKECDEVGIPYDLSVVVNIGSDKPLVNYVFPSRAILAQVKPDKIYRLSIKRDDYLKYRILKNNERKKIIQ